MRKGQKENSKETNDLQLSYDMNAWVEGEKEKTPPSRPCLDISTIRSPPTTSCPMMCIRWLSWPGCLIRQSPRHEIVMNGSDTFFRAIGQFYWPVLLLLPLPWLRVFAPEPPGDTWSGMKEFKGKGRTSPHVVIVSFFVSTPCPARRKSHTTIKKRNMRKDREQRAVIGRTLFACNNMQHRSLEVYLTYPLFGTCLSKNPDYLYCMHNTPYRGWLKKEKLNSFNASSKGRQAGSCRDKEPDATLLARNNFNKVFFYSSFLIRRRLCYQ